MSAASKKSSLAIGILVGQKFRIGKKIGSGSFGTIRAGVNLRTNEVVAIKLELNQARGLTLPIEYRIYQMLGTVEGVPRIYHFGPFKQYHVLIMEMLGPSVERYFHAYKQKFSLKTCLQIVVQMVRRIEYVHSKGIVYRDIKPENFLLGPRNTPNENTLYIVDFGLSKLYIDPYTKKHIPYDDHRSRTGTARYMSINSHMGIEQSRRDDLISIGYVLVYLVRGSLPWQGMKFKDKEARYKAVLEKKRASPPVKLCRGLPEEILGFMQYVTGLQFYDAPDYEKLQGYLKTLFDKKKFVDDGAYDWTVEKRPSSEAGKSVISRQSSGEAVKKKSATTNIIRLFRAKNISK